MPAQDRYHDLVIEALEASGWTITDDPFRLGYGSKTLWVDLGTERETLAAEKQGQKIAVEIKSFARPSEIADLEQAVGQYNIYRDILSENEPDRVLFLAVPLRAYDGIFEEKVGRLVIKRQRLNLIVFDEFAGGIVEWITHT